jgi:hypothetical protein
MATQFYKTLDQISAEREQRNTLIQEKIAQHNRATEQDYDDELARLKTNMRQLGVNKPSEHEQTAFDRSTRMQFIKENNIKHGSPRWFRVMYARPELTGEDPFGE